MGLYDEFYKHYILSQKYRYTNKIELGKAYKWNYDKQFIF